MAEIIAANDNSTGFGGPVDPELEEMVKAGVHLGHAKAKSHPSMQANIFGIRNTISIIDVVKTKEKLHEASEFLKKISSNGGMVLFVGTRPSARKVILEVAEKTNMPYFVERWIGGTLTNFRVIAKRVEYLESLEREKASGGFEKYTKKERMLKEEEMEKLRKMFDGIRVLKRQPDAVFVVDITHDGTAVQEAKRMKIPVVALVDSNSNALTADYAIPSNDDALKAVQYMVSRIGDAIIQGQAIKSKDSPVAQN